MERCDARLVFEEAACFTATQLRKANAMPWPCRSRFPLLQAARDRISEALSTLDNGNGSLEHEDLYLALFDAMAFINDALVSYWDRDTNINRALACLDGCALQGGVS